MLAVPLIVGSANPSHAGSRPVVVYDSDMDFDDAVTLAYLAQEHRRGRIDLRAVTVVNNGIGKQGKGLMHARCVLERVGVDDVPVADGSPDAPNAFPTELRDLFDGLLDDVTAGCTAGGEPSDVEAPELISKVAADAPHAKVVVTGPMTNVAAARLPKTTTVVPMGGAVKVPGNLFGIPPEDFDGSQEFNAWIDPVATKKVLVDRTHSLRLVPLDATNDVPITNEFIDRLRADNRTPAAGLVLDIVTHPDITGFIDDGIMFWWDVLAAMTVVRPDVVDYERATIEVVLDGKQAGRTKPVADHGPLRYGVAADTAAFEQHFFSTMNARC